MLREQRSRPTFGNDLQHLIESVSPVAGDGIDAKCPIIGSHSDEVDTVISHSQICFWNNLSSASASVGGLFHSRISATRHLNAKRPQPFLNNTGAVIPMRQSTGATMTGATIKPAKLLPVPSRRFTWAVIVAEWALACFDSNGLI